MLFCNDHVFEAAPDVSRLGGDDCPLCIAALPDHCLPRSLRRPRSFQLGPWLFEFKLTKMKRGRVVDLGW
jgi:hypothetical protein